MPIRLWRTPQVVSPGRVTAPPLPSLAAATLRAAVSPIRRFPGIAATGAGIGGLAYYGSQPPTEPQPAAAATAPATATPPFRPLHPGHSQPSSTTPPKSNGFLADNWPTLAVGGAAAGGLYGLHRLLSKDEDEEKQATFAERAMTAPNEILRQHPVVAGFLIKCAEFGFDDQQIIAALRATAVRSPEFNAACVKAGLVKGASRVTAREARFPQASK